jgi:hypothetical protein
MYNNVFYFYSHFRVSMDDCCPFFFFGIFVAMFAQI